MKILLASDTWSPMVNGVVRSVELLYHQLLALGHDVRVVTLAQNGHSHEENGILYVGSISAERVYPGVRISAAGALPISHWLDELEAWGPEVIHTQSEFSTFMLAQRVARRCHCPVVHTYHTVYEDYTQYLFFSERLGRMTAEKATRILSGYCSLMLAPTEKVRAMLNRYGVSCPVVTVPTGIDLTAFGPAKDNGEEKARMRAELGIPEGDTVLLSLGRLAAESDLYCLVTYGEQAKRTAVVAAAKGVKTLHANNYREAADALLNRIQPGDALLVKASRGMALEKVLEIFYAEQKDAEE